METIGRIAVKRNKKERRRRAWLTIGLIAFVITMICEIALGNFAFSALIVPFLYLLSLRCKMGKSVLYKDVSIIVNGDESNKKIEISNCEYYNKKLYSVRFIIPKDNNVSATYFKYKELLLIKCNATKVLFFDNTIIPAFKFKDVIIQLYVRPDDAVNIANILQCLLNIKG